MKAFGTHLRAYLGLFQALPKLEFIYLAPTARLFQAAESRVLHTLYGGGTAGKSVKRLLDYFRIRRAWEAKERVASADVVLLKEAQARSRSSAVRDCSYQKWAARHGADRIGEVTVSYSFRTRLRLIAGLWATLRAQNDVAIPTDLRYFRS